MGDYFHQAKTALQVYLTRGDEALRQLAASDHDGASETLRLRYAALCNFRTADVLASREGWKEALDRLLGEHWEAIQTQNARLAAAIDVSVSHLKREAAQTAELRLKISRYQSGGSNDPSGFQSTV